MGRMETLRKKEKPRDEAEKEKLTKRLSRLCGQIEGIRRMVEDDRYCGDILLQLSAAEGALREIANTVYKTHMLTCVKDKIRQGDDSALLESFSLLRRLK